MRYPNLQKKTNIDWVLPAKYMWIFGLFIFLLGFSRIYLGAHTINQVVLGFHFGVLMLIAYFYYFEELIERNVIRYVYQLFNSRTEKKRCYVSIFSAYFGLLTMLIIFFLICEIDSDLQEREQYWKPILVKKCNLLENEWNFFQYKCLNDGAGLTLAFGLLFSFLRFKGEYMPEQFKSAYQNQSFV